MCKSSGCNGILSTNCNNNCQANWIVSGSTCAPSAALSWYLEDTSPDLAGGGLTISNPPAGPSTLICGSFNMYGTVDSTTTITIDYSGGVINPFFQMIAYVGIISMDASGGGWGNSYWGSSTQYFLNFTDGTVSLSNSIKLSSKTNNNNYCFSGRNENWNRLTATYTYNTTGTPLNWILYNNNQPNTSALWGMKEFILITRRCNTICTACYGTSTTQCYACVMNATDTYWQSNNTCSTVCLNHFGYTDSPNVCVYCDLRCTSCYNTLTNCSSCTTSGTWTAYLDTSDPTNITCVNPCSAKYFANKTAHTCDPCNVNCSTCLNSANYCESCVNGSAWTGWSCYNPCPNHYFLDSNLTNCTACSSFCQICVGPSTLCTVCTLNGTYTAYLFNTTNSTGSCLRVCPAGYYAETFGGSGPNLCLPCNGSCSLCTNYPSPC